MSLLGAKCELDTTELTRVLQRYQSELGASSVSAFRSGVVHLLKALRKRTRISAKQVKRKDIQVGRGRDSYRRDRNGRWCKIVRITRDTDKGKEKRTYLLPVMHGEARNNIAMYKQAAQKKYGQYTKRGLARSSWGWMMKIAFGSAYGKITNRKIEGIKSKFTKQTKGRVKVASFVGLNALNYSKEALLPGAEQQAVRSAANKIRGMIEAKLKGKF